MTMATTELAMGKTNTGFFQKLKRSFQLHALRRQTEKELHALTDRELADIGLHRSMIASVAREAMLDNHF